MGFIEMFCYIVFACAALLYLYFKWSRQYWAKRNVPSIDTIGIWGNVENPLTSKRGIECNIKELYDEFKTQKHVHAGIYVFTQPVYLPINPELIKHILTKDFQHFTGHGISINKETDPLNAHLFNLEGEEWRNMRIQLTPTYTSGKMRMMFNTLLECGLPLIEHVEKLSKLEEPINIKEILACYSTDVIGSCAFGIECNSFKNPDAEFRKYGRQVFQPSLTLLLFQLTTLIIPAIRNLFYVKFIPNKVEEFFLKAVENVTGYREANNFKRNDFIQLFLEINRKAKENGQEMLTLKEIAAQSFVFFIAGFEASSTTMTFCLHELAFNQDIQDKLREEIKETLRKNDGKLTYDSIMEMPYMDKVINETLRKYPPARMMNRICNKTYKVPNTDLIIEEGIRIFISIFGLHRDEEYYPNPNKFDPERFSEENKAKRHPYTFIPFGEGPRKCIGLRFGVMQAKTGLAMLLNNYKFLPAKGETYEFDFEPTSLITTKKGNVMLTAVTLQR